MSAIRERLGLPGLSSSPNTSDVREKLGLTNVSPEIPKNNALKFASTNEKTDNLSSQYKFETLDSKSLKKEYEQELENQTKLQDALKKNLKSKGFTVNVSPFDTTRVSTFGQQASKSIENKKFESTDTYKNIEEDIKNKQEYKEYKETDEYKNQLEKLKEASNKVGYAKYNYDVAKVAEDNIGLLDKSILGNLLGGARSIFDYTGGLVENEKGDIVYLPNRSELKQQKVQESYENGFGKFIGSSAYNLGRIGASTLLNAVVPYAGSTAYFGKMFQENRDNAILDGYDGSDATVYALANVTSEVITGKLLGAATKGLTGGRTNEVEKLFGKLVSKFTQNPMIISFLSGAGSEATEEFTQEYIDNFLKLALLDKSTKAGDYLSVLGDLDVLSDAAYSAAVGALTGGITNPFQVDSNTNTSAFNEFKQQLLEKRENAKTEAEVKTIDNTIEKLEELSTKSDEELIEMAKEEGLIQEEQPQITEQSIEEQPKTEEVAPKEEIKSKDASKEEVPKAKVSKPLNFREALTDYEVEDILQQINTYDQEQIKKNLITTERVLESYNNNKIRLAYATLALKDTSTDVNNARAENNFKYISKKLSDTDKFYIYRNLDKTNPKLAEMAEKYFAPTEVKSKNVSEQKPQTKELTYKNAKNIQQEEGYTAYYEVPAEDYIDIHGRKGAYDIDAATLNDGRFDLITYNDNGTRNIYEFDSKKDLNKYIKSIGGYSALEGQYTIMSNSKEGEFYYVRDKYAKGGWQWEDSNGRVLKGSELRTTKLERERIKEQAKKANMSVSETAKTIETIDTINKVQLNETPAENMSNNDIHYTKDGIQTSFDEKVVDDVIKIIEPNEKPQTITLKDKNEEVKIKKASSELNEKGIEEVIKKYSENLTDEEKKLIKQEIEEKRRDYTNAKKFAIETKNKSMLKFLNIIEEEEIYDQIDVSANVFKQMMAAAKDIDDFTEKFNIDYLNDTIGSKDGTPTKVNYDTIAKGQAIVFYQIKNNNMEAAMDALRKVKRYGTTASQALNQLKAMYQNTEYGIYLEAQNAMDDAYESFAKRHTQKWRDKNNPQKNPNSKFKFTEEDLKIISKGSSELYNLHKVNHDEYCIQKGKLQQFIGDKIPKSVGEQITNWVRSALLLSPKTVIKNAGSNILDSSYHAVNKANYSVANKVLNKAFGTDIVVAGISIDGVQEGMKAYLKTSSETARIAFNNLIHKTSVSTEYSNKYSSGETSRDNVTKDFFNTMPSRYQTRFKKLNNLGNVLSQLSYDSLAWGDAKFQAQSYADNRLTLRLKNAFVQQRKTNKNIIYDFNTDEAGTTHISYIGNEGKYTYAITNDLDSFLNENKNFAMLDNMKEIDDLALSYSESRTYVGDTKFSKVTSDFLGAIDRNLNKLPVIRSLGIKPTNFIVPFSKIGSNLCYKMYRGSVLSIPSINKAMAQFKAELADGKVSYKTQYDVVSRVGDLMTGTMVYMFIGSLAKAAFDNVEGDEDDDEASKVSKFMKSIFGKDKYTFKVGDYNFSFDVGGNLSNMLKMSLDLQQLGEQEDKDVLDYIDVALGDMLSEWTVNNITEILNTQYNDNVLTNILQTIARIPSMAIPNFMKDLSMQIDDFTQRSVWDEDIFTYGINSIKAKIPPLLEKIPGVPDLPISRASLPEKLDSWGNTMKAGDNLITSIWNTYIVSDQIKKDNSDPVSQELMQQYLITGKTSLIPNVNKNSFSYNKTKYTLTNEEEQQYLKTYAKSAHDNLDKLFYSSVYQDADTETKLKYIEEVYEFANDEAKKEYLNNKNTAYYNYGQKVIISGSNNSFKQATVLDAVDKNISYQSATKYQSDEKKFNYYQSFGSYDKYKAAINNVEDIQTTYSSKNGYSTAERKQKVIEYVNTLNNLTAVQKAILIKEKYPSAYKSYNEQIKTYLKKQNLDEETYTKLLKDLGITK